MNSISISAIIGTLIVCLTVFVEGKINLLMLLVSSIFVSAIFLFVSVRAVFKRNYELLALIDWAFGQIEKGEPLPPLNELRQIRILIPKNEMHSNLDILKSIFKREKS